MIRHLKNYREEAETLINNSSRDVEAGFPFFCLLADLCTHFNFTRQETIEVMGTGLWNDFNDWLDTQVEIRK